MSVPLVLGLTVLLWTTLPLWVLVAAAVSPFLPGRWRAPRVLWMVVVYLTMEAVLLAILLGLWLASGFGRRLRTAYFEGIHYDLVQGVMAVLFSEARRVLHLEVVSQGSVPDAHPGVPILVCCRHAGPGDSFTLIHTLMAWYSREPRVVLKATLAWDPVIDTLLHRIPARFITPGRGVDLEAEIAALATGLDENDAFVIFPEGGNFTQARRHRAIERLDQLGLHGMARRAEEMVHVLAPRPGGLLAALDAAPGADVVLVAHTGLDHVVTARELWRAIPIDKQITMKWWQVPRSEIPADREERIDWLYGWWERIDAWVEQHRVVVGGRVAPVPTGGDGAVDDERPEEPRSSGRR